MFAVLSGVPFRRPRADGGIISSFCVCVAVDAIGVNVTDMVHLDSYSPEFYASRPQSFADYADYEDEFRVLW